MTGDQATIIYRLHLQSLPTDVFTLLTTDTGRAAFWAERSVQDNDHITFYFPNGETLWSRILESAPPYRFSLTYFDGRVVTFELAPANGGTDLRLEEAGVPAAERAEQQAGWVSVLLALKAQADHGVDLRNHDPGRTWGEGYVDN